MFVVDDVTYLRAEKQFSSEKARLFGDDTILQRILRVSDPALHKRYGRVVEDFDQTLWEAERENIMLVGSYAKFSQIPEFASHLRNTGGKLLAEASPYDPIWGTGLRASHPDAARPPRWRGDNLLGEILVVVRDILRHSKTLPTRSAKLLSLCGKSEPRLAREVIFEVSSSTQKRLTTTPPSSSERFASFSQHVSHVSLDHDTEIFAVSPGPDLLPEQGECLKSGTVTVDDYPFTAQILAHCGPVATQFGCAVLLGTGSPQSVINSKT